jgi:hypothetical protein
MGSWKEWALLREDGWYYRQEWECECCGLLARESILGWVLRLLAGRPDTA